MKKTWLLALPLSLALFQSSGCDEVQTSDKRQTAQQETLLQEATSQVGMPSMKNFRERKLLKDIYELRDQTGLSTFTYTYNEMRGCLVLMGNSVGYGIPYATQFTSPQRPAHSFEATMQGNLSLPQADPNGLFSPSAAEGTWVLLKDPQGPDVKPVYIEPRVVVSPFALNAQTCR